MNQPVFHRMSRVDFDHRSNGREPLVMLKDLNYDIMMYPETLFSFVRTF